MRKRKKRLSFHFFFLTLAVVLLKRFKCTLGSYPVSRLNQYPVRLTLDGNFVIDQN